MLYILKTLLEYCQENSVEIVSFNTIEQYSAIAMVKGANGTQLIKYKNGGWER